MPELRGAVAGNTPGPRGTRIAATSSRSQSLPSARAGLRWLKFGEEPGHFGARAAAGCQAKLPMSQLNYHHLKLFWAVARESSVTRGAKAVHLTPQTVSGQLREFEASMGCGLLRRVGRGVALTEAGQAVYEYAERVFADGTELLVRLQGGLEHVGPSTLRVGVVDSFPKLLVRALMEPALAAFPQMHLQFSEGTPDEVIAELAVDRLDVVLSDQPIPSSVRVRAFNHLLGECGVVFMGTRSLARRLRRGFPLSLHGERLLLPSADAVVRRDLEQWFVRAGVRPNVVGEFQDSALLKVFGQCGAGVFAAPAVVEALVAKQYTVTRIGLASGVRERYYAISVERRIRHQAVSMLCAGARSELFAE